MPGSVMCHTDIRDDDIRRFTQANFQRVLAVPSLANHLDAKLIPYRQGLKAFTVKRVVIHDEHFVHQCASTWIDVALRLHRLDLDGKLNLISHLT